MHNLANGPFSNITELQAILSGIPGVVYRLIQTAPDQPVQLTCVSANCRLIFGVDHTVLEAGEPPFLEYIHPSDREQLITALSASAQTLGCCLWTGRILQPSGTVHWVHLTAQPTKGAEQSIQWQGLLALTLPSAAQEQPALPIEMEPFSNASSNALNALENASALLPQNLNNSQAANDLQATSPQIPEEHQTVLLPLQTNWSYAGGYLALKHIAEERTTQLQQTVELLLDEVVERTQAERHLRDREAFLHSIYDNVRQSIFVVDVDEAGEFRYADLNAACEHIFDMTRNQAEGKTPEEVLGTHTGQILRQQYQQCVEQQVGVVSEDRVQVAAGKQWWRTQLTPLQNPDGTVYRIIGNTTDITHQKQIETNLKRRDRLLRGVAIATQHLLTHAHLYEAIPRVLSTLGAITEFDHIYILEAGEWITSSVASTATASSASTPADASGLALVHEWGNCGTCILPPQSSDDPNDANATWIDPQWIDPQWPDATTLKTGRNLWYTTLKRGEAIMAAVDRLPEPMQAYFTHYGVRSILAEPIMVNDYIWGYICFEDCTHGYRWPTSERSVFRTVSANLAGAIARQQVETELLESTELLQLVMDNIPQAVFWKDRNSVYLGCNINFAEAAGMEDTDDVVGKCDVDLCWLPEEAELYYQNDQFVMANDIPLYHVIEPQRRMGEKEILCEVNKIPLHHPNGEVVGILGTFEDVTEREVAQAALQQSEAKYRLQTQELQVALDELQQAQLRLIQSEKMTSLGLLVAGIAHEINNPINFIYGNVEYAHNYATDLLNLLDLYETYSPSRHPQVQTERERIDLEFLKADFPKLLESMRVGSVRIRDIVASLRLFSRMDEAEYKVMDIHDGIDSTLMLLQSRINPRDGDRPEVQVLRHYGDIPMLECFAGPLNQVFMNLLSNALDALEDAVIFYKNQHCSYQPCLTLKTAVESSADSSQRSATPANELHSPDHLVISITDNALGIAKSDQPRLFDPFFTTKPVGKGTGMGLSISYQIITERHGGNLECVSELGQGTTFIIELPLVQTL